jgi:hypothetical protein
MMCERCHNIPVNRLDDVVMDVVHNLPGRVDNVSPNVCESPENTARMTPFSRGRATGRRPPPPLARFRGRHSRHRRRASRRRGYLWRGTLRVALVVTR